ncbi:MAG: hypothetical protein OEW17_01735 [Gemmatimonadota bacterium]|nr:hypothetical protein [Gemmatimonadota bacterium]
MNARSEGRPAGAHADQLVSQILRAAHGWAREAPEALRPYVRAVCIRLGEMIADQRNFFAPLPEPQEAERAEVLALVARQLASAAAAEGVEKQLQMLSEMELRSTSSWALQPGAQSEWTNTAIGFLEEASQGLPADQRPDPYWSDDVVAGVVASVRAVLGIDDLHARTEAQYPGSRRSGEEPAGMEAEE